MNGNAKRPFADLLTGLQQNKLSLVDVIQSLNARGQVQSPLHRAELSMLDEALKNKKLDEKMHRLLVGKLKDLQQVKVLVEKTSAMASFKPGNDDQTVVAGGGDQTRINPAGDKTTINPAGGGNGADGGDGFDLLMGEEDEKTEMGGGAETTGFKPQEHQTGSRTGGTSGPNTSSWQRVAAAPGVEREVHAGDVLKERFYLDKEVGRGGMGIVFKARDERKVEAQDKNPWVAVKVLNPEFRKHPQALVALQRESRKAQQLTHDNILRVYDFDKDGTVIYMTMEYVDGGSLKDVIKKHPQGMPFAQGWPIIAGLARGLGRAHRDNIVHSDFKPGNVMMTSDLIPKLFDMGIARAAQAGGQAKGETTVFDAGELGALTPAYASLEMIQGQPPQLIDDMYALGVTAYEILTGKHPFNKKNAEQAMKEGLKPPTVHGLSRTQQKTLQSSVAFKRDQRCKTCDDFLDGMRPRTIKDSLPQLMGGGLAAVLVLVGIFAVVLPYLAGRRVDSMIQQFATSAFADPTTAVAALNGMSAKDRDAAMAKGSKEIRAYFFNVANSKWDVANKKYDHPAALQVVNAAKELYPDSADVATNLRRLDDDKKKLLDTLNDEFTAHIDANRIYEDKSPNVVETVSLVRQIDPVNELLKDKKLAQRYTNDVRASLEAGQYAVAEKRAATSVKVFPADTELAALQRNVKEGFAMQLAAAKERELREKMTAAEAKTELAKLAANPLFTPEWQVNVNVAMSKLTADSSPETMQAKSMLATAFAKQLGGKVDAKDLVGGQMVADASTKLFGSSMPNIMKELGRFNDAKRVQQAEEAAKAQVAEVDSLKRTFRSKTDANNLRDSQAALDKLIAMAPADPFTKTDGPKLLGEAYLRSAQRQAEQGRYDTAADLVEKGLKVAPTLQGLKDADKQYRVEGAVAVLQAGASQPAAANGDKLKSALEVVRTGDPARFGKLSTDLQNGVLGRLQALTSTDPASAGRGKTEWLKVFPQNTQLASLVIPTGVAAPATTTASAASPSASLPSEARKARRAPGVDTCQSSFAGFGRSSKATCLDDVAGAAGPRLVVVPGIGGGAAFAITKYEIKAAEFNAFCSATGKCKPQGGNEALPRTNVTLAVAKAYAAWLTETTGFTYRLPTDAEWAHAANAGGAGAGEDFQCIVMAGGSQIKGGNAIPVSTGKPNPWGLMNTIGNAAEFVDSGSARGGHFNTPTSQCTLEWRQSGGESDTVGLRLVREMG